MLHKKQFKSDATVKGSGIDLADLVAITCFNADRGLANMAIENKTAPKPMSSSGAGYHLEMYSDDKMVIMTTCKCVDTAPGMCGDAFGE